MSTPEALNRPSENVIATKEAVIETDSVIVLGAHYDSISDNAFYDAPGADDNASGTAGVVELARVLKDVETTTNIQFCLFSAEELGLHGSKHYAKQCRKENVPIKVYFNFDMIAYPGEKPWSIRFSCWQDGLQYLDVAKRITVDYTDLHYVESIKKAGYSDHKSFQDEGFFILTFGEKNTGTGNPYYHSTEDTFETLSMPFEKNIATGRIGHTVDNSAGKHNGHC